MRVENVSPVDAFLRLTDKDSDKRVIVRADEVCWLGELASTGTKVATRSWTFNVIESIDDIMAQIQRFDLVIRETD